MASALGARLKHAWNAFKRDPTDLQKSNFMDTGQSFMYRPDRLRLTRGPDKTIIASVYNRIAMDAASAKIQHVQLDGEGRFVKTVKSSLNLCLSTEANIDQTGRALIQDAVLTMLDTGCVALVPTETDENPLHIDGPIFEVISMRTATVQEWMPKYVKVDIYNEVTGQHAQYTLPKSMVAIVENPFYPVMNEPNSTMQRLIRKLTLMDAVDEQTGSGKLNMIIQLPYIIRTEAQQQQAKRRREAIEQQLMESKYGIAYTDGTEKVIQINKPLENTLLSTIEFLTSMLYSQLGITTGILDGTADESTMLNYNNRVLEPILSAVVGEMKRKFLTKNARTRGHSIEFYIDPFKLLPISNVADIANSLTRNEIMTSNEFRQILGMKPSLDPGADILRNKNMPIQDQPGGQFQNEGMMGSGDPLEDNAVAINDQLDELQDLLNHSALAHYLPTPSTYASKYYDPEKAHEYYMKNRELKGQSTAGLNEEGRKVADYVKKSIYEERDKSLADNSLAYKTQYEKLRADRAQASEKYREQVRAKLEAARGTQSARLQSIATASENRMDTLQDKKEKTLEAQQKETQSSIDQLREKLENMTPEDRERHAAEYQEKIDELRQKNDQDIERALGRYEDKVEDQQEDTETDREKAEEKYEDAAESAEKVKKNTQALINDNYYKSVSDLVSSTKANRDKIKEDALNKWLSELEKIQNTAQYQKGYGKTTGAGRGSGSGSRSGKAKAGKEEKSSGGGSSRANNRTAIKYNASRGSNARLDRIRSTNRTARSNFRG